jgi:L-lactate dehydrogenase (cytochrome)
MTEVQPLDAASKVPGTLRHILSLADFEQWARRYLPHPIFSYIQGGVEDNQSLQANLNAFQAHEFIPRVLNDVSARHTGCELFGMTLDAPFGIGPMGISALAAYDGDCVLARAAAAARIPMVLSGASLTAMEEVAASAPGYAWFQAYLPGIDSQIVRTAERAKSAGFQTLVLTVDTAARANRENNVRARFSTPLRPSVRLAWDGVMHPRWLVGTFLRTLQRRGMPRFENTASDIPVPIISTKAARQFNRDNLSWAHVALMRRAWPGHLVLKGILSPDDARLAAEHGVDGIVVSNHGGRQLDGAVSPLKMLPRIAEAAATMKVMYDGGIRRGGDVIKALALGADFVFVARPFLYAASVGGERGVAHAIGLLREEVRRNMGSLGLKSIADIHPGLLLSSEARGG